MHGRFVGEGVEPSAEATGEIAVFISERNNGGCSLKLIGTLTESRQNLAIARLLDPDILLHLVDSLLDGGKAQDKPGLEISGMDGEVRTADGQEPRLFFQRNQSREKTSLVLHLCCGLETNFELSEIRLELSKVTVEDLVFVLGFGKLAADVVGIPIDANGTEKKG
jgi:hypothetical protein